MVRDHVEFLDPAELSWNDGELPGFPEGTKEKELSRDDQTGASTRLLSLPAGETAMPSASGADTELFVVSGRFQLNDRLLKQHDYAFVPAGSELSAETTDGCRLLYMPNRKPTVEEPTGASPEIIDTAEMAWEQPQTEGFPTGAARKSLHYDEKTGAATWLLGVLPGWRETRIEVHPVAEEAYQVQGSMVADQGHFSAGKYFWRPAGIPHGPFLSSGGCLTLFRVDGELAVEYVGDTAAVDFLQ